MAKMKLLRRVLFLILLSSSFTTVFADSLYSVDLERDSSQYASIANNLGIDGGQITVSAWIKPESTPSGYTQRFVYQSSVTSHVGYGLSYADDSGTVKLQFFRDRGGVGGTVIAYTVTLTPGTWYHVMGTYDGSNNLRLYLDGSLVAGPTSDSGNGSGFEGDRSGIGADWNDGPTSPARYFDGMMDEVLVYSTALSGTDLTNLFDTPCDPTAGYVARWQLENDYLDTSANNYDLTSSGSPVFSSSVPFTDCAEGGGGGVASTSTSTLTDSEQLEVISVVLMLLFGVTLMGLLVKWFPQVK